MCIRDRLNATVQILLKRMDQMGAQQMQTEQLEADAVHKVVDILAQPDQDEAEPAMTGEINEE